MRAIDADELLKQQYKMGFGQMPVVSVDAIKNAPTLTPPNEWVRVEERLPEQENTQVLMTDGECHYISSRNNMVRFLDCEWIFIPGKAGAGVKVTHWMPLPAPPDRRPPEGDCEIKACAETCDECGFCDDTLASPPEGEEDT